MRKAIITTIVTGLIGFGGIAAPMAAFADAPPAGTDTTLAVTGGALTLTAAGSATLTSVAAGQQTAGGSLGTVTVNDRRADYNGAWTASVTSSDFSNSDVPQAAPIPQADLTYTPGDPTAHSGNATFTAGDPGTLDNSVTAYSTSDEIGVALVSWDPSITLALPSDVVAGTYGGTITHSVA